MLIAGLWALRARCVPDPMAESIQHKTARRRVKVSTRRRGELRRLRRIAGPAMALAAIAVVAVLYWFLIGPGLRDARSSSTSRAFASEGYSRLPAVSSKAAQSPANSVQVFAPLSLPRDEGPHSTSTEWWYYNGHLSGPAGQRYSFHAAVFLRDGVVRHTVFHGALNEYRRGTRLTRQLRTGGVPSSAGSKGFDFTFEDFHVAGSGGKHGLRIGSEAFSLELEMADSSEPVLHRVAGSSTPGILDFGAAGKSYYYSRPRMKARGTLAITGAGSVPVEGEVWFDHQWGDFEASRLAWNWFALQLADGANVMVYEVFDEAGAPVMRAGTYTDVNGESVPLASDDVMLSPKGAWRSSVSGVRYPEEWAVKIPQGNFTLKPMRQDSEFNGLETTFAHYWEGAVEISGTQNGQGFVEMSGYDRIPSVQAAE